MVLDGFCLGFWEVLKRLSKVAERTFEGAFKGGQKALLKVNWSTIEKLAGRWKYVLSVEKI